MFAVVASVFGIGYIRKGGGTVAAVFFCILWYLLPSGYSSSNWQWLVLSAITILGIVSGNEVEPKWGKDSYRVVIDEVAGMALTLLYAPQQLPVLVVGCIAFRFFDIAKPLGVRKMEKFPGGWGVMADDLLAGFYGLVVTQLFIYFMKY
jgi:phosphatidylglycerophosphatase A